MRGVHHLRVIVDDTCISQTFCSEARHELVKYSLSASLSAEWICRAFPTERLRKDVLHMWHCVDVDQPHRNDDHLAGILTRRGSVVI